jgi:cell division protein FtsW (lipid II flippase)
MRLPEILQGFFTFLEALPSSLPAGALPYAGAAAGTVRWLTALLACHILYRAARSLLARRPEEEVWAYLRLPNGAVSPVSHWENTVGRAPGCDLVLNYPTVSRSHAALIRGDDGSFSVSDLRSKGGTLVNGTPVSGRAPVAPGDAITFSGVETAFLSPQAEPKTEVPVPGRPARQCFTLLLVTLFQLCAVFQLCLSENVAGKSAVPAAFAALMGLMWLYYLAMRILKRTGFEAETLAFFLTTLGFSVTASAAPDELFKQLAALILGMALFLLLGWYLRDLERAKKARWAMGGAAIALLAANLLLGRTVYGAQNWIFLGPFSFQPSEFVKVAFIYAGSSTLDRLLARRNLILFIAFSGVCIGTLALLGDFGTALVFFAAFLVIAFLRSGDLAAIGLICAGAGFAGLLAVRIKPYIARRFSAWRHVWQYADTSGYQQTRTLVYAASGGLLGLGAGNGYLKTITAADTALAFGVLCEEWGLIVAVAAVACLVCLAAFTVRSAPAGAPPST